MDELFDTIAGLPVHPLVVHAAVVLLPLAAVGLLAIIVRPVWRERFGPLVLVGLVGGTVAAFVAKESGEALAKRVGLPTEHASWGDRLPLVAVALSVTALLWYAAQRRSASGSPTLPSLLGGLAAVLSLATMAVTVLVGHSGATAAWGDTVSAASTPTSTTSSTAAPSPAGLTMAQVAAHNQASDCWVAIEGKVYDLTSWVARHPGGPAAISGICGTEASAAFRGQHGTQTRPNNALTQFLKGPLSSAAPAATPATYTAAQVAGHASARSCWSIINGQVYDLTAWVSRHPGGSDKILRLCGIDGTEEFQEQHGGQTDPAKALSGYKIGALG